MPYPYDPIEAPQGYDPRYPNRSHGVQEWNVEGGRLSSTTEPQPTLKNPGRYWVQDEDNVWREADPESEPRLSDIMAPGQSLVDPRTGERVQQIWDMPDELKLHIADIVGRHLHGRRIADPPR